MSDKEINLLDEISDDPDDRDSDYGRGYAAGLAAGLDELFRRAQRDTKGQPESWAFVAWLVEESRKIKAASDAA